MIRTIVLLMIAYCVVTAGPKESLKEMVDNRDMRVVYIKLQSNISSGCGKGGGFPKRSLLAGYDTYSNSETIIMKDTSGYLRPLLTYDAQKVVYSDVTDTSIYVVNWDGSKKIKLASGICGALWLDTITKKEYAIYCPGATASAKLPIYRVSLDDPSDTTRLFYEENKTLYAEALFISQDGKNVGSNYPWPGITYYNIDSKVSVAGGIGCYPTAPYDNSLRVVGMTDNHDGFNLYGSTTKRITIAPEWVNDVDSIDYFGSFTMQKIGSYSTDIYCVILGLSGASLSASGAVFVCKIDTSGAGKISKRVLVADGYVNGWPDARAYVRVNTIRENVTIPGNSNVTVTLSQSNITFTVPEKENIVDVSVSTLSGRNILMDGAIQQNGSTLKCKLDKKLSEGVYLVTIHTNKNSFFQKVRMVK